MGACKICGKKSKNISSFLNLCRKCIISNTAEALEISNSKHEESRQSFSLPYPPPSHGVKCGLCGNECEISEGQIGFCGLTTNEGGTLIRASNLIAEVYYDPHPTNCVPMQFCAASGAGYPEYSYTKRRERAYCTLSVFCVGCSYDCSFCQNWQYRTMVNQKQRYSLTREKFSDMIHNEVSCVCFFGGDPCVQLDKIIDYCTYVAGKNEILRFCLETSGHFNKKLLLDFAYISLKSGGGIKFDFKFCNPDLSKTVTGVDNQRSYECFKMLRNLHNKRPKVPFLRASTLLLPGYTPPKGVEQIAKFISEVSQDIPYSLLAFQPCFEMEDLPYTSKELAHSCKKEAEKYLETVRTGNGWLLRE